MAFGGAPGLRFGVSGATRAQQKATVIGFLDSTSPDAAAPLVAAFHPLGRSSA